MMGFRARVDCTDSDPGTEKIESNIDIELIGRAGVRPGGAAGRTPSPPWLSLLETTVELHSDSESAEGSSSDSRTIVTECTTARRAGHTSLVSWTSLVSG
jgi:hypothetical protein